LHAIESTEKKEAKLASGLLDHKLLMHNNIKKTISSEAGLILVK